MNTMLELHSCNIEFNQGVNNVCSLGPMRMSKVREAWDNVCCLLHVITVFMSVCT